MGALKRLWGQDYRGLQGIRGAPREWRCTEEVVGEIGPIERCRVGGWWGGVEWGGVWWRVERGRMVWGIAGWSGKWQGCSRVDWSRVD